MLIVSTVTGKPTQKFDITFKDMVSSYSNVLEQRKDNMPSIVGSIDLYDIAYDEGWILGVKEVMLLDSRLLQQSYIKPTPQVLFREVFEVMLSAVPHHSLDLEQWFQVSQILHGYQHFLAYGSLEAFQEPENDSEIY